MNKLSGFLTFLIFLFSVLFIYVRYTNRNTVDMTIRQKTIKTFYPTFIWFTNLTGIRNKKLSNTNTKPIVSFYQLTDTLIDGTIFNFSSLKNKKILLVNTASNCGYTNQYADLQNLHQLHKDKLVVIGFPANDFKEQEKGDDLSIHSFCQKNYGVTFLLMKKSSVIKTAKQNPTFQWLTNANKNGWNNQEPTWNFCKYIVNEDGVLTNFFESSVVPLGKEINEAINK